MNRNIEQKIVGIRSMMRGTQKAFDDLANQWHQIGGHATIAAKNASEMNEKLAQALAYYYTPTAEEYRHFDEHCDAISAAGGNPPNEESHWSELAFNHWEYQQNS